MGGLECWPVDPLTKVFREDEPGRPGPIKIEAARNEYESGQIGVSSDVNTSLEISCSSPRHVSSGHEITCLPRFVGYVWVRENARDTPEEEIVHAAPAEFPDYLMEERSLELSAGQAQPVWLTMFVPESSPPGEYRGRVAIKGGGEERCVGVSINVHPAAVPRERTLMVTNWLNAGNLARFARTEPWSEQHWDLLERHALTMAAHRQNVILTPMSLIRAERGDEGRLTFDFSRFDRWVELFSGAGVDGLIEGGHLAGRSGDWDSGFQLSAWNIVEGGTKAQTPPVKVESPACEDFLSRLMPALQAHLEERGWMDRYVQHLADEPSESNAGSYRRLAELVGRYSPKLRRIDANMTPQLQGCLEIWVPVLDQFDQNMTFYRDRAAAGDEVWFYTCLGPRGKYPNRFIDFSLLKVRILHWINFRFGLSGYLHWGYNHWTENPFRDTQPDWSHGAPLPAGDQCIVYPGPRPLESIRFEAMRDGIEDYELMRLVQEAEPDAAERICSSVVRSPTDYEHSSEGFAQARKELLEAADRLFR